MAIYCDASEEGYVEVVTGVINSALEKDLGPLTAGALAVALVDPNGLDIQTARPKLREAFAQSNASHDQEMADAVITALTTKHDALLSLAS